MKLHILIYEIVLDSVIITKCKVFKNKPDLEKFLADYKNSPEYDQGCDYYIFEEYIDEN